MSEEKEVKEIPVSDQVKQTYQKYANKCFELGQAIYKMNTIKSDFEISQSNQLIDIDKLAKDHDKLMAKQNAQKVELPKSPEGEAI